MTTTIPQPNLQVDLSVSTLRQAQALELHNRRTEMASAISDLERVKRHSGRGNLQAAYDGYNRVWARIERLAKALYEMTGEESEVPLYDPPQTLGTGKTQRIGAPDPFAKPEAAPKPHKPIPGNIKPGTRRWYEIQGHTPPEGCPE